MKTNENPCRGLAARNAAEVVALLEHTPRGQHETVLRAVFLGSLSAAYNAGVDAAASVVESGPRADPVRMGAALRKALKVEP